MNNSSEIIPVGKHKLVFLGDQSVGKTSIITRFVYDQFDDSSHPTVGIDFISKTIETEEQRRVRLQLWDTAGQERFRTLIPNYIRGSAIAVIVYDVTSRASFESVASWHQDVQKERGAEAFVVLLANKVDLQGQQVVSSQEGQLLSKQLECQLFQEVSAKQGTNIFSLFKAVAQLLPNQDNSQIISQPNVNHNPKQSAPNMVLNKKPTVNKKKKCC